MYYGKPKNYCNKFQNRRRYQKLANKFVKKTGDKSYLISGTFQLRIYNWIWEGYNNEQILQLMIKLYKETQTPEFQAEFMKHLVEISNGGLKDE